MVKRYNMEIISEAHIGGKYLDVSEPYIEEEESPDGEWVNYSDYKKLLDDVKELNKIWELIKKSENIVYCKLDNLFNKLLAETRTTIVERTAKCHYCDKIYDTEKDGILYCRSCWDKKYHTDKGSMVEKWMKYEKKYKELLAETSKGDKQ